MAGSVAGTLITVAPTGAEAGKAAVPALPVSLAELVVTAKECEAAGAAVIHVHIRDDAARPTLEVGRLADTVAALREGTGLIVQLSTGGAVTDSFASRLAVLDAAPDACSLTCGTVNFGDDVFSNPLKPRCGHVPRVTADTVPPRPASLRIHATRTPPQGARQGAC